MAATASCDVGSRDDQGTKGPPVHVLGLNVGDGRPMPADGVVQIAFDRYLLPRTVNRQAVRLVDAGGQPLAAELAPVVIYDPVARAVTLRAQDRARWLTPGLPYKVQLALPRDDADLNALRAIDGATLDSSQPLEFAFYVSAPLGTTTAAAAGEAEEIDFCRDVRPIFDDRCATCHVSPSTAAMGLALFEPRDIVATAIGRTARGARAGGYEGPRSEPRRFGVDMPIIDPANPGNSWLVYKIELAPLPASTASADAGPSPAPLSPLAPIAKDVGDAERALLASFVPGREMPHPRYRQAPIGFDERETLRMWIARGARVRFDCPPPAR